MDFSVKFDPNKGLFIGEKLYPISTTKQLFDATDELFAYTDRFSKDAPGALSSGEVTPGQMTNFMDLCKGKIKESLDSFIAENPWKRKQAYELAGQILAYVALGLASGGIQAVLAVLDSSHPAESKTEAAHNKPELDCARENLSRLKEQESRERPLEGEASWDGIDTHLTVDNLTVSETYELKKPLLHGLKKKQIDSQEAAERLAQGKPVIVQEAFSVKGHLHHSSPSTGSEEVTRDLEGQRMETTLTSVEALEAFVRVNTGAAPATEVEGLAQKIHDLRYQQTKEMKYNVVDGWGIEKIHGWSLVTDPEYSDPQWGKHLSDLDLAKKILAKADSGDHVYLVVTPHHVKLASKDGKSAKLKVEKDDYRCIFSDDLRG